jgi:hypothetical protein
MANMLINDSAIATLDMSANGITSKGLSILSTSIKVNECLRELDLSANDFGAAGMAVVAQSLSANFITV